MVEEVDGSLTVRRPAAIPSTCFRATSHDGEALAPSLYNRGAWPELWTLLAQQLENAIERLSFAILPLLVLLNLYLVVRDRRQYTQFKRLTETKSRQRVLRRWVMESAFYYGLIPLLCLLAVGHGRALWQMPEFLVAPSTTLNTFLSSDGEGFIHGLVEGMSSVIIPFLLFGHTAFTLGRVYTQHKSNTATRHAMLDVRDVEQLFPRNKDERFWTALLSISAGINEELSFRLVIPLLIFLVSGSTTLAIVVALLWFGLAHFYQGWFGVIATLFLGAVFLFVYLKTGSLWLAMLIHTIVDLNDLAFAPWFAEWLERR